MQCYCGLRYHGDVTATVKHDRPSVLNTAKGKREVNETQTFTFIYMLEQTCLLLLVQFGSDSSDIS